MRKRDRGLSMNPGCCRHPAGRETREKHCRQDAGSTLAVPSHLFEVHGPNACEKTKGGSPNLHGHRIAACLGKAALKTHALQTLSRCPLTRPQARSVWSASDLSALSVGRGTASGSWS